MEYIFQYSKPFFFIKIVAFRSQFQVQWRTKMQNTKNFCAVDLKHGYSFRGNFE